MTTPSGGTLLPAAVVICDGVIWQGSYELGPFAIIGQRSRTSATTQASSPYFIDGKRIIE